MKKTNNYCRNGGREGAYYCFAVLRGKDEKTCEFYECVASPIVYCRGHNREKSPYGSDVSTGEHLYTLTECHSEDAIADDKVLKKLEEI